MLFWVTRSKDSSSKGSFEASATLNATRPSGSSPMRAWARRTISSERSTAAHPRSGELAGDEQCPVAKPGPDVQCSLGLRAYLEQAGRQGAQIVGPGAVDAVRPGGGGLLPEAVAPAPEQRPGDGRSRDQRADRPADELDPLRRRRGVRSGLGGRGHWAMIAAPREYPSGALMAAERTDELEPRTFEVVSNGVRLAGEEVGEGPPIVLLHGITATRRYVLHGSLTLARRGYRLISYDARGHGESSPAPDGEGYGYPQLMRDLGAVLADRCPGERPVLCGHSMGCHTVAGYALDHADEIAALVLEGPVTLGIPAPDEVLASWDRLADGLERARGRGVHGGLRGGPRSESGMARDRAADHARAHGAPPPSRGARPGAARGPAIACLRGAGRAGDARRAGPGRCQL